MADPNKVEVEPQAFSIAEFCARNKISETLYHKLKSQGRGPRTMELGRAIRITAQAERDWQNARENPQGAEAKLVASQAAKRRRECKRLGALSAGSPRHFSKTRKRRSPAN